MLPQTVISKILVLLEHQYQNTTTAIKFGTPFQLLISTMLSAQTTDKQVNRVTRELFKKHPDAGSFLRLNQQKLEQKIKTVGLYRLKAKNVLATCKVLLEEYGGNVPVSRDLLMKLPGVGRKTANVFLSVAHKFDAIAVDTHVFRVSNRIGLARAGTAHKTEQQLMQSIPQNRWSAAHHWLIWHGRKICKARNPLCRDCFLNQYCLYYKNSA